MSKLLRSMVTIQHSPVAKDKEERKAGAGGVHNVGQKTINRGDTFDPSDLQLTDADVKRMRAAGHVVDADDLDAIPAPGVSVATTAPAVNPTRSERT